MLNESHPSPLPARLARTLYNVALVWGVETPDAIVRLAPAVDRALRHRGVGSARRIWLVLRYVEWRPCLAWPPGRSFSRRAPDDRLRWLERIGEGPMGRQLGWLRDLLLEAAGDAPPSSPPRPQSSPGA